MGASGADCRGNVAGHGGDRPIAEGKAVGAKVTAVGLGGKPTVGFWRAIALGHLKRPLAGGNATAVEPSLAMELFSRHAV